jgi:hypothetical protein
MRGRLRLPWARVALLASSRWTWAASRQRLGSHRRHHQEHEMTHAVLPLPTCRCPRAAAALLPPHTAAMTPRASAARPAWCSRAGGTFPRMQDLSPLQRNFPTPRAGGGPSVREGHGAKEWENPVSWVICRFRQSCERFTRCHRLAQRPRRPFSWQDRPTPVPSPYPTRIPLRHTPPPTR